MSDNTIHSDNQPLVSFNQGYMLRGLAMLMLFFAHSINEYEAYNSTLSQSLLIPHFGTLACSIFFWMSGYGMWSSLSQKGKVSIGYLLKHLRVLVVAYIVAFVLLCLAMLLSNKSRSHIDFSNLLCLSMPDGTDIWFFKAVVINYVAIVLLFMTRISQKWRIILLGGIYIAATGVMYVLKCPSYWYFSILSFPLGALFAMLKPTARLKQITLIVSLVLFIVYYLFTIFIRPTTPSEIVGNMAFATLTTMLFSFLDKVKLPFLTFIGKQSLYYYLLGIAIMTSIDSTNMHWSHYFIVNLLCTTIVVLGYKLATSAINAHDH